MTMEGIFGLNFIFYLVYHDFMYAKHHSIEEKSSRFA